MKFKNILIISILMFVLNLFANLEINKPEINIFLSKSEVSVKEKAQIVVKMSIPEGLHQTFQEDFLYLEVDTIDGMILDKTIFPKGEIVEGVTEYKGEIEIKKGITFSQIGDYTIKIKFGYQLCQDNGTCLFPEEMTKELKITVKDENIQNPPLNGHSSPSIPFSRIFRYIIFAFLGGIILNAMPCVLPVLSIKAMSLVKQSQHNRKQILHNSVAYTGGILVSFIILATVVVVLKASGELVGWGFQLQSPTFVIVLLSMVFVFALSMFDVLIFTAPGMQTAYKHSSKSGLLGSFMSGVFAVLLATPCSAPLLGTAIGFAFQQPPLLIYIFFFAIGFGLALPFFILGFFPSAIKIIPKPGEWMNIFKEVMGFLLIGTVIFLLRTVYFLVGGVGLLNVLWFLLFLGFATWMYGRWNQAHIERRKQWFATIGAILILIIGAKFTLKFTENPKNYTEITAFEGWQKFSPELLEKYQSENKPVFIDFGAEWCMTCKTNEKTVLFTSEIKKAFKEKKVELLRGDYTKKNDLISSWLTKYNRSGVPLYLFFPPGKKEAIILPEIITKKMILEMLENNIE